MKAKVMRMNGGRIDGYYYVGIEGTHLRACDNGHPCFPSKFKESTKDPKKKAQLLCREINRQLRCIENNQQLEELRRFYLK